MLFRELKKVEAGEDPICVIRDPEKNRVIELPLEKGKEHFSDGFASLLKRHMSSFSPIAGELLAVFTDDGESNPTRDEEYVPTGTAR
jgi:5,5'-dehydrodivanillate O-demethylase